MKQENTVCYIVYHISTSWFVWKSDGWLPLPPPHFFLPTPSNLINTYYTLKSKVKWVLISSLPTLCRSFSSSCIPCTYLPCIPSSIPFSHWYNKLSFFLIMFCSNSPSTWRHTTFHTSWPFFSGKVIEDAIT